MGAPAAPASIGPHLASDDVLRIARLKAERAYRNLTTYRIAIRSKPTAGTWITS